jgi:hypothetical protein
MVRPVVAPVNRLPGRTLRICFAVNLDPFQTKTHKHSVREWPVALHHPIEVRMVDPPTIGEGADGPGALCLANHPLHGFRSV